MILFSAFVLGILVSFVGSLPIGVLNLSVIQISGNRNLKQAYLFSFGAALVEFIQAFIAIWFAHWFLTKSNYGDVLEILLIPVMLILGIYYWRKDKVDSSSVKSIRFEFSGFSQGALLSIINPMAIPFWIFYSAWFYSNNWIEYDLLVILILVIGISLGTFLCLALYGKLGSYIYERININKFRMNQIIGTIFIVLAIIQGLNIFL